MTKRIRLSTTELLSWLPLAVLVFLSGTIISLYAMFVAQVTRRFGADECVKQATLYLSQELSHLSVDDPVFGKVGLCDCSGHDQTPPVTSLNRLYATVRLDWILAQQLDLPYMKILVKADLRRVQQLEQRIHQALSQAIESAPDKRRSLKNPYEGARQILLSASKPDETLTDFKVCLGGMTPCPYASGVPATLMPGQQDLALQGQYKALVAIPMESLAPLRFYPLAPEATLVENAKFLQLSPDTMPSVVHIQARFRSGQRSASGATFQSLAACAVLGGSNTDSAPSNFMISFPHGTLRSLKNLKSLLGAAHGKPWTWQQVEGGEVPGSGHLSKPVLLSEQMTADQALQTALYRWLRQLGPAVKIEQVAQMLDTDWSKSRWDQAPLADVQVSGVNSALVKDTGAREFALLYQSGPGQPGQTVLKDAFESGFKTQRLPPSAIPLAIDADGNCNLAGRKGFNKQLVRDFLAAVYQTNIASVESIGVSQIIVDRLTQALHQTELDIALKNEELTSTFRRLKGTLSSPGAGLGQSELWQRSQREINNQLSELKNKQKSYWQIAQQAKLVEINAKDTARLTLELCSNIANFANEGIFLSEAPHGFLLKKGIVFVPQNTPVTEEEIYTLNNPTSDNGVSWTDKRFNVIQSTTADTTVEGHRLEELPKLHPDTSLTPKFVLFDSRQLTAQGQLHPLVLSRSPFSAFNLAPGQLIYYATNAIVTGQAPEVGWSILIRDLSSGSMPRLPSILPSANWFSSQQVGFEAGPCLALEIQIRSPVAILPDLPLGSYLVDPPTKRHVSQIPPMPASML